MAKNLNMDWLYIEGDLPDWLNSYDAIGIPQAGVAWAVQQRYQLTNKDGIMVSMFPIEDSELFRQQMGPEIEWQTQMAAQTENDALPPWYRASDTRYRIISQEECDTIHAQLLDLDAQRRAEMAATPTEDDIYRAEQLLLLTELCNGVAELKNGGKIVE